MRKHMLMGFLFLFVFSNIAFAVTNVSACGTLSTTNEYYQLNQSINSSGTCITIGADNITLDGQGYTINYSQSSSGYGIVSGSISPQLQGYSNITIKNLNIVTGSASSNSYGIYMNDGNLGIGSNNWTINNNTITTSGATSYGIWIRTSSSSNNVFNNTISASSHGINLVSGSNNISNNSITATGSGILVSSDSNIISNNLVSASGSSSVISLSGANNNILIGNNVTGTGAATDAFRLISSSTNNNITGGSITSKNGYDYYIRAAGTTNNFTDTNFTEMRQIYFYDTTSWFNYNNQTNGNIWLQTAVSAQSSINRTIVNWNIGVMRWNDTGSTSITATYNITGLIANVSYIVQNTSNGVISNPYNLTVDANGILPSFTIALSGNTEINVSLESTPPALTIQSPINQTYITTSVWFNITGSETLSWSAYSLDGAANATMTNSSGNWNAQNSSMAKGAHTVVFWANDTAGNMNTTNVSFTIDNTPPFYSNLALNNTSPKKNETIKISALWSDSVAGLSHYIFSWNATGSWINTTTAFLGNWSNITQTITQNKSTRIDYIIYANDSLGNLNQTIQDNFTVANSPPIVTATIFGSVLIFVT